MEVRGQSPRRRRERSASVHRKDKDNSQELAKLRKANRELEEENEALVAKDRGASITPDAAADVGRDSKHKELALLKENAESMARI